MQRFYTPYLHIFSLHRQASNSLRMLFAVCSIVALISIASAEFSALPASMPTFGTDQRGLRHSTLSVTMPTGHALRLQTIIINGQQYCTLSSLAALFPGSIARESEYIIQFKTERLRFSPSSFFVALSSPHAEDRIAQMNMPVISIDTKALVPAPQFFRVLQALDIYSVNITDQAIVLKMTGQNEASAPTDKKTNVSNQKEKKVSELQANQQIQPGRYALPADIDKTAMIAESEPEESDGEMAAIQAKEEQKIAAITGLTAYRKDSALQLRFTANRSIESFQKPEIDGNEIIMRFSDMDNAVREFGTLVNVSPIQSVRVEKFRDILVYRIRLTQKPLSVSARRVTPHKVALEITVPPQKKSEIKSKAAIPKPASPADAWKLNVVVLDAGHGGTDEGAASISGHREKDITLAIALKARDFLRKIMPDVKVVLTRATDTFIALDRRGQIANEAQGKLFVSIHCNSMPTKPHHANGFETYILRPGRNAEAIAVAERENAAIKFEKKTNKTVMSEEQVIVATMAQAAFVKFSELFASIVQQEMKKLTNLKSRGVSQAGFLVLVGASMPNVLFESAFLSNENDEKFIASSEGQAKTAEALANAIRRYAHEYAQAVNK